jgi:hypothetical protein
MSFLNTVLYPTEARPAYPTFLSNIKSLLDVVSTESEADQFVEPILNTLKDNH